MEYILILLLQTGGVAVTSIMFPSQQACETAKELAIKEFRRPAYTYAVCVPRGTP